MSARDSADDLLADWLLRRDGPELPPPVEVGYYRTESGSMPIRERMARRQGLVVGRQWPRRTDDPIADYLTAAARGEVRGTP